MKLMIVRHGEPDYSIDSLTPKGWREAELLAKRLSKLDIKDFYVSPLGRAQDTASFTLKKMGRQAKVLPWLQEFDAPMRKPNYPEKDTVTWDWLPQDWMADERFFHYDQWLENEYMQKYGVKEKYDQVIQKFDQFMEGYGYKREGHFYRVVKANHDLVVLFCHFGLECVLLSHLLGVSPMILWHNTCVLPSAVTLLISEERKKGIGAFRMNYMGDISHLYAGNEEPSFAVRFCETFEDDTRH